MRLAILLGSAPIVVGMIVEEEGEVVVGEAQALLATTAAKAAILPGSARSRVTLVVVGVMVDGIVDEMEAIEEVAVADQTVMEVAVVAASATTAGVMATLLESAAKEDGMTEEVDETAGTTVEAAAVTETETVEAAASAITVEAVATSLETVPTAHRAVEEGVAIANATTARRAAMSAGIAPRARVRRHCAPVDYEQPIYS